MESEFKDLLNKTLQSIDVSDEEDEILFKTIDGCIYRMYHEQDCCESVYVEDICGDINDLIGMPILQAEESFRSGEDEIDSDGNYIESYTYTFYKLATFKGYVTIRWYGESNGYYSESVDFENICNGENNCSNSCN